MQKENQKQKNESVLMLIEHLMSEFETLIKDFDEQRPDFSVNNIHSSVKDLLERYYAKLRMLFEKVDKSYGLIQMVIQSIHASRSEIKISVKGLIQKTGTQLQKVTSTTEEATNKILDATEKLDQDQTVIMGILEKIASDNLSDQSKENIEQVRDMIRQNQDAAFLIMDYLQFQDITAQQIAGAYALLADTERTLIYVSNMLRRFAPEDEEISKMIDSIDRKSFNEKAQFSNKKVLQDAIDDLFTSGNTDIEIPEEDEKNEKTEPEKHLHSDSEIKKTDNRADKETNNVNQDDIDELFK